ncbi:hypothetical protein FSP39_018166 [Pinctada imbricata]|uniref:Uncharacterized protein n=1 Tax=Pinctada imbricata TaxID=66713 RepID=A0AA88YW46_PINIB|nr:hypothetical protein FSP39_018166 [Pinctada imbricata]
MAGICNKGKAEKRMRETSTTSPTQPLFLKKLKTLFTYEGSDSESVYLDAEESDQDIADTVFENIVSDKNMADGSGQSSGQSKGQSEEITHAIVQAFKDPEVTAQLIGALRDEIRKNFREELKNLKSEIERKDVKIKSLESKIDGLEDQIEGLEMYGRRNGVRIYGIPESRGEDTDAIVLQLADDIGAGIPPHALGRSHRVGPADTNRPRPIIAKFVGHNFKVKMLKNKKKLRDNSGRQKIFINEDLTSKRAKWAKRARGWKKDGKLKDTWTRDGVLFVKMPNDAIERINSDRELQRLDNKVNQVQDVPRGSPLQEDMAYNASTDDDSDEEDY